jgi:hypothetical protein
MALDTDWQQKLVHLVERVRGQERLVSYNRERAARMRSLDAAWTLRSAEDELADRYSALRAHIGGGGRGA